MPRADYLEREAAVAAEVGRRWTGGFRVPRHLGDKQDFGDLDVLVADGPGWSAAREHLADALGVTARRVVGRVFSLAYRGLQTDLFTVPPDELESTYQFMCFNDLGNILGRMCRRFNLKFGERGLTYVHRSARDPRRRRELPVSKDLDRVLGFLELDPAPWHRGFAGGEEMFRWVVGSPYFSVAPYLDGADRPLASRVAERSTLARFVAFLRAGGLAMRPQFAAKESYLAQVEQAFPDATLASAIARAEEEWARGAEVGARFSGDLVMRLRPELSGRALGAFMRALRASLPDFERAVLKMEPAALEAWIAGFPAPE